MDSISRRKLLQAFGLVGLSEVVRADARGVLANVRGAYPAHWPSTRFWDPAKLRAPLMKDPVWVYDNWSAYAEGSKTLTDTRLTEELAMQQLEQVARLQRLGVRFDYYMMNAFWFAPDGAYREWRKPDWPNGPDHWISACHQHGLKPGLWFGTNSLWKIDVAPEWEDSLEQAVPGEWYFPSLSLFEGGFLADFMRILEFWYARGIRMFELDAVYLNAATVTARSTLSESEIRERSQAALSKELKNFRSQHKDVMLVAFNDFGGDMKSTLTPLPFRRPVDLRWLDVFDTFYSGDTRASEVPQANIWRSIDIYNDHMVRGHEQSGMPLERLDPFFTLSTTWFGYNRGKKAWRSMLLLLLARGGWKRTIYGNLKLLTDDDVRWFARVRQTFEPLISMGRTKTFGGVPGEAQPYGFGSVDFGGALYTVVNPAQQVVTVELPLLSAAQSRLTSGRVIFRDAGHAPILNVPELTLGPGQMAVVGFGRYADEKCDLGLEHDIVIPNAIRAIETAFRSPRRNTLETTLIPPKSGDLRVFFQQRQEDGSPLKSHTLRGKITAHQFKQPVALVSDMGPEREGWGGVSWSSCEIRRAALAAGEPVTIQYQLDTGLEAVLTGNVYSVEYT